MIGILAIILQKNEIDLTEKNRQNGEQQNRILANETVFSNNMKNMADLILDNPTKLEN